MQLCLKRENNPYVDADWEILFVYIDCEMCLSCSYVDEIVVQNFQSVQKFSAFFLNAVICIFASFEVLYTTFCVYVERSCKNRTLRLKERNQETSSSEI